MAFGRDSHYTVTRSLLNEPWSPAQAGLFFVRPLDSLDADRTLIFSGEQGANDRIPISVGGVGISVNRSVPVLTKCTSTCSSAGTALTDHYWVGIALCGSLVWSTNVGLHSCGRALLPRCRSRRQQHQDHRKSGRTIRGRLPK